MDCGVVIAAFVTGGSCKKWKKNIFPAQITEKNISYYTVRKERGTEIRLLPAYAQW